MAERGSVVYIRYRDHVLFRDAEAGDYKPFVREAVGWFDHENDEFIRLVWERFAEPSQGNARERSTGLVILKSCILELREVKIDLNT
jgi:hypothetical protein